MRSFPTLRAISALILREMATAHGRIRGGYLWAVAEPVAAVTLLVLVFSVAFESRLWGAVLRQRVSALYDLQ